jgi:hypothetical protein
MNEEMERCQGCYAKKDNFIGNNVIQDILDNNLVSILLLILPF